MEQEEKFRPPINNVPPKTIIRYLAKEKDDLLRENAELKEKVTLLERQLENKANAIAAFKEWQSKVAEQKVQYWLVQGLELLQEPPRKKTLESPAAIHLHLRRLQEASPQPPLSNRQTGKQTHRLGRGTETRRTLTHHTYNIYTPMKRPLKNLQPWLDYFNMLQTYQRQGYLEVQADKHEAYITRAALATLVSPDDFGPVPVGSANGKGGMTDATIRIRAYAAYIAATGTDYPNQPFALHIVKETEPHDLLFTLLVTRRRHWLTPWKKSDCFEVVTYTEEKND